MASNLIRGPCGDAGDAAKFIPDPMRVIIVSAGGMEREFNLIQLVRLGVGASYRYTTDIDLPGTPKDAPRGFNVGMTVKVGSF